MRSPLPGTKTLLVGPTGTGKTTSLRTFIDCGITPMCIFTEPRFGILGSIPPEKLHWKYIPGIVDSLEAIEKKINHIGTLDQKGLCALTDFNRHRDSRMIEFVKTLNNFTCERTGQSFGPVKDWGTDKVLVFDGLSGIIQMAWFTTIGSKPAKDKPDYGKCQDLVMSQIDWACLIPRCHFVLIAHADRNFNEVTGETLITPALPGKALTSIFARNIDDVVLTQRVGTEFKWSTAATNADLKASYLPVANDLKPDFTQIIKSWQERGGLIEKEEK